MSPELSVWVGYLHGFIICGLLVGLVLSLYLGRR